MNSVRSRLSIMMFLQYAVWGAWAVSLGGYMGTTLQFTGLQIGSVYSTTAIAAMISPLLMGILADRLFSTEKLIGVLHLLGAGLLAAAAYTKEFTPLYVIMIAYSICYMPTLALTNSISFANIGDPESEFPRIRVWGTWGWIIVGWLVGFVLDVPPGQSHYPVLLAAGLSAVLGLFSLLGLPHTPPQKNTDATQKTGVGVIELLGDPSFLVFVVCSFLICIPLSFYYGYANLFITEIDAPFPTALQTVGQLSEVGFMAAMPFFIARLGVKRMLICGMLAWGLRYFAFGSLSFSLVLFGLFLHGICYDFFFVASQIYVDNRVDASQRASAQSFIALVTMGIGMFVGSYVGGWTLDHYPPGIQIKTTVETRDGATKEQNAILPAWDKDTKDQAKAKTGLAKQFELTDDSLLTATQITADWVETNPGTGTKTTYTQASLKQVIEEIDADKDGKVSRGEWRLAQRKDWFHIWLWPAIGAVATCLIFIVGFHDTGRSTDVEEPSEATGEITPETSSNAYQDLDETGEDDS